MATMRFIHVIAGFVFIGAFLLRMYWFFKGNEWSNWRAFVPIHRRQWRGMGNMVAYYSFLRKDLVHQVGHNALAAVTYLVMFTLMFIEIITGLTLYTQVRGGWLLAPLFSWLPRVIDIQYIRLTHFCIMFAFFAFTIHHVYSAVLVSWEERNGLIESIFTGYKFVPKAELEEDSGVAQGGLNADTREMRCARPGQHPALGRRCGSAGHTEAEKRCARARGRHAD